MRLTRVRGVPCADAACGFGELGRVILPARLSRFLTVVSGFSPVIRAVARVYHKAVPYELAAFFRFRFPLAAFPIRQFCQSN